MKRVICFDLLIDLPIQNSFQQQPRYIVVWGKSGRGSICVTILQANRFSQPSKNDQLVKDTTNDWKDDIMVS